MTTASDILRTCLAAAEPGGYKDVNYNDSVSAFHYLHRQLPKQANARKVQVAPGRHAIVFKIDVSESSEAPTDVVIVELDGFSTQAEFGTDPRGKPYLYFYGIALTPSPGHGYRDEDDSLCPRTGRDILRVILDKSVKMTDGYLKQSGARKLRSQAAAEPEPAPNFHAYMNQTLAMLRQHDIVFSDGRTTTTFRNRGTDAFDAVVKCPERDWERTVLVRLKNESDVVRGRLVSYLQVLRGGQEYFLIPTSIDSLWKWLSFVAAKASGSAASAMDLARTRRIS